MRRSAQTSTPQLSPWTEAIRQRRKAMPQRLALGLISAMVFAPLIGLKVSLLWGIGYVMVIALEHAILKPLGGDEPKPVGRVRTGAGAAAVAVSSLYFGALSVPLWFVSGFMGGVCSVLLLTAGAIYGMINSRGSRLVLAMTGGVQIAYLMATPVFMLMAGAPAAYATVATMAVLVFAAYCISTWGQIDTVRRSEVKAKDEALLRRAEAERILDERNAFMASIGHDLRTPLTAILAGADGLERGAVDASNRNQARLITDAAEMMCGLLDDLLDHAKLEAGRMDIEAADFDLRDLILQTARLWRGPLRAKGLKLRLVGTRALPSAVQGDALRLRQVLNNLISNAVKFTDTGGVTLKFCAWADDPTGYQLLMEVSDTGAGMTPAQLTRLFTPYDQTQEGVSARHGGTGLGLAISRHLVTLMGGRLTARSEPGLGSTFTLSLALADAQGVKRARPILTLDPRPVIAEPVAMAPEPEPVAAGPAEPAPLSAADLLASLGGVIEEVQTSAANTEETPAPPPVAPVEPALTERTLSVLVVDDHEINRRALQLMLGPMGCNAVLAVNGLDALDRCASETFDLIFMDVRMPELDGRETTRRLRASGGVNAATPVIAVTADTQPEDVRACLEAGMSHFVGKPITPAALAEAISLVTSADADQARVA